MRAATEVAAANKERDYCFLKRLKLKGQSLAVPKWIRINPFSDTA